MKSNIESLAGLKRKLSVELPLELVKQEFDKAYATIKKDANLKGFRKGHAPLEKIKQMYGDNVKQDVAQNLVRTTYFNAISEHKLEPVNFPNFDFGDVDENSSFKYSANFEVKPEVKVTQYEGLKVNKENFIVTKARIDKVVENIKNNYAENVDLKEDRPIKNGDIAILNFEGFVDGKPMENGSAENHNLEIGSNQFIPGFEEALIGLKKGDTKEVNLTFPEDYHAEDIKGKPVKFKVVINNIQEKNIPELNEEFLKKVGDYKDVADLRSRVTQDIEDSESKRIEDKFKDDLLKAFAKANPVEVPDSLFQEQKGTLVQNFQHRMQSQGLSQEQFTEYQSKWADDFDETAKYMVQTAFLIEELANEHKLNVTPKDIEDKFTEMAKQTGIEVDRVKSYYGEKDRTAQLKFQLLETKVVDFLKAKAVITEVESKEDTDEN